jgi:hypothetical protein
MDEKKYSNRFVDDEELQETQEEEQLIEYKKGIRSFLVPSSHAQRNDCFS